MEKEKRTGDTIEYVNFNDFKKCDLRVAKIIGIKDHPNADKLYILDISLGKGEHDLQLVAGLRSHYKKEDLLGKKVCIIKNLEHAIIRGVESQGMILAAVYKDKVTIITPQDNIETGAKIQ